jgi:hypothetical protein
VRAARARRPAGRCDRADPGRGQEVSAFQKTGEAGKIAEIQGMISTGGSAKELADFMRTEVERWATIIKTANSVKE